MTFIHVSRLVTSVDMRWLTQLVHGAFELIYVELAVSISVHSVEYLCDREKW